MKYKVVNGKLKFSYDLHYEIFLILLIPEYYKVLESWNSEKPKLIGTKQMYLVKNQTRSKKVIGYTESACKNY